MYPSERFGGSATLQDIFCLCRAASAERSQRGTNKCLRFPGAVMQAQPTSSIAKKRAPIGAKGANAMLTTLMPLLLATLLGVAGQLVLKYAMSQMGALQLSAGGVPMLIWRMATSPYVIGGLLIYGLGTFFW